MPLTVTRAGFTPVEREVSLLASPAGGVAVGGPGAAAARSRPASAQVRPRPLSIARLPRRRRSHRSVQRQWRHRRQPLRRPRLWPVRRGGIFVVSTPNAGPPVRGRTAVRQHTRRRSRACTQGAHVVRVEAPGYRPWEGRVAVVAGTRESDHHDSAAGTGMKALLALENGQVFEGVAAGATGRDQR